MSQELSQESDLYSTLEEALEDSARGLGGAKPNYLCQPYTRIKELRRMVEHGKIPLGCYDSEYSTEVVSIPYSGKSLCILCSSNARGSGKTFTMGTTFFDMLSNFHQLHRIAIDPKHEFWSRRKPNIAARYTLEKLRMKPRGNPNLVTVTPSCLYDKRMDYEGLMTQYSTRDLTRHDLLTMMNLNVDKAEDARHINKMNYVIYGQEYAKALAETEEGDSMPDFKKIVSKKLPPATTLLRRLLSQRDSILGYRMQSLLAQGILGEETPVDLINLLNKDKVVVYQTTFNKEFYGAMASYIAIELRKIIHERTLAIERGGAKKTRLPYPVVMYFGEFNVYYPRRTWRSSKEPITQIYDQMRAAGLSIWGDSPNFHSIDTLAIRQSDYIFTFKVTGRNLRVLKEERGLTTEQADDLKDLSLDKNRTPPGEMCILPSGLDAGDELIHLYPLPSLSMAQQEQAVVI